MWSILLKAPLAGVAGGILILSFPSPGTECDQDCRTRRNKGQESQPVLGGCHLPRQRVQGPWELNQ